MYDNPQFDALWKVKPQYKLDGLSASSYIVDELNGIFKQKPYLFKTHLMGHWHKPEVKSCKQLLNNMGVERVIFNNEATIVFLKTGEKGVAVKSKDDTFDPVVGFCVAYAIAKGTSGNKSKFHHLVSTLFVKRKGRKK